MKKVLLTSGIAILALVTIASAQNYSFDTNLTVGSTGADVVALQTWLMSQAYEIPAISSGVAAKGYFGSQTLAAVKAYQAANGIPNTGFVGPLTRTAINARGGAVATANCPVGYRCVADAAPVVVCPIGYRCIAEVGTNPVVVTPGSPLVMDGTDGSLTVSLSSYASNVTIKKGETKDMVAVKLQATAAPVSVTRLDVRMDKKPWLYFSKITLKDSAGTVIATKNISSIADVTEVTVATDYLIRFEGINYTVTPGTDKILVVSGTVLAATDKLTADVTVNVAIPSASIRTLNGKGYTDSLGLVGTNFTAGTTGRLITLSGTGSIGNILARIAPSTPAQRIVTTSTSGQTNDVILGVFDFKSENTSSRLNTLTFSLKDNSSNKAFSVVYKNLRLVTPSGTSYNVDAVASTSVFSNLDIAIAQDIWTSLTLKADIADQDEFVNGMIGSTTITTVDLTNPVGSDSNDNSVKSTVTTVTSNDFTFLQSGASITNQSATAVLNDNGTTKKNSATAAFTFTFNNTGNTDLYISANPSVALATTSTLAHATSSVFAAAGVTTDPSSVNGDSGAGTNAGYYKISSNTARTFTFTGTMNDYDTDAVAALRSEKITAIYFSDASDTLTEFNIGFGLEKLQTPGLNF